MRAYNEKWHFNLQFCNILGLFLLVNANFGPLNGSNSWAPFLNRGESVTYINSPMTDAQLKAYDLVSLD